jgi:3',5'-cyclic AMP phosphodiesterase CpdA
MKIAHISDLHLDKTLKLNYKKTMKLMEYIVDSGYDHLVITGDITENSEPSAFELARKMLKKYELLDRKKTSIVIGNHDIFGGVHLAEDVINFPTKCRNTDYDKKVNEFGNYFHETFENTIQPFKDNPFPFIKEFDEFVLIGLNSIAKYSVLKNPFASNGEVTVEQINAVEEYLNKNSYSGKHKIILAHHHFCKDVIEDTTTNAFWQKIERQTMKLRGKKKLVKRFKKSGINLVLHGHLHESNEYSRKQIKFLNAGGSILNKSNELHINTININGSNITNYFTTVVLEKSNLLKIPHHISANPYTTKSIQICLN